jgi:basic membrane protein A and related proteins
LLLLVQAGATATHPRPDPSPTSGPVCPITFRVGFVADVAGLRSSVDAAGWRGVSQALRDLSCGHADLALPARPSEYRRLLQAYAGYDLVIAGSFLLTDPVMDAARANPTTHFVLIDPIVMPPDVPNLAVLTFRADQAAFLAGALAGLVTRTGVVAGVYGPQGAMDLSNRLGFEHGARYVRPGVRVLGAYQPADGPPYADPVWGADQARAFSRQHADVIFGAGGTTGQGALLGAAQSGVACINADIVAPSDPGCLLASSLKFIDRGVQLSVAGVIDGQWRRGVRSLGLAEHAVGLSLGTDPSLTTEIRGRLQTISDLLAAGSLSIGG